jgi:hypothetical protein
MAMPASRRASTIHASPLDARTPQQPTDRGPWRDARSREAQRAASAAQLRPRPAPVTTVPATIRTRIAVPPAEPGAGGLTVYRRIEEAPAPPRALNPRPEHTRRLPRPERIRRLLPAHSPAVAAALPDPSAEAVAERISAAAVAAILAVADTAAADTANLITYRPE